MDGGYDNGYRACSCFWGTKPGSLLKILIDHCPNMVDAKVLDAGCGEGKNAAYLAGMGAHVTALDVSEVAIASAKRLWSEANRVGWECKDIRGFQLPPDSYDIVIAYGLLHCLKGESDVQEVISNLQNATKVGGFNVVCVFNDRRQELAAHPGFSPTLLNHDYYVNRYESWDIIHASDTDLHETHPHNNIPHCHSMTRIVARKRTSL